MYQKLAPTRTAPATAPGRGRASPSAANPPVRRWAATTGTAARPTIWATTRPRVPPIAIPRPRNVATAPRKIATAGSASTAWYKRGVRFWLGLAIGLVIGAAAMYLGVEQPWRGSAAA